MDKKQLFEAIYAELEAAEHLGTDQEHYYYVTGVVGSALKRLPSPSPVEALAANQKEMPAELQSVMNKTADRLFERTPVEGDITELWNKYAESLQGVVDETEYLFDRDVMTYTNFKKALAASSGETMRVEKVEFDKLMEAEIDKLPYRNHVDAGQYADGKLSGFEMGAEWAYQLLCITPESASPSDTREEAKQEITEELLESLGFVTNEDERGILMFTKDKIEVWQFNNEHWIIDMLDQGGIDLELIYLDDLELFFKGCGESLYI